MSADSTVQPPEVAVERVETAKDLSAKSLNVFGNALQAWTEIDLSNLQKRLDEQGIDLKNQQKESLLSRKDLALKTKDFRKLPDSDKLDQIKPLLKLYQNEIDSLTNKQKKVETYFFGFYRSIAEAPDPRPLLELSLDSVIDSQEVASLKKEINKLNEELSKKADYDHLKQRMLRTEQKSAELLSSKLHAKEEEFKAVIEEKESNWAEKERSFEIQTKDLKHTIDELRTSKEVTELQLNSQNKQIFNNPSDTSTLLSELDIVARDAENAKKRAFELEKRNESLRRELSISQNDVKLKELQEECNKKVSELEGENALLNANLRQARNNAESASNTSASKAEVLNREIMQLSSEVKNLKTKIEATSDYDEIKRELLLMRQIEFGHGEEDDAGDGSEKGNKQIESLFIERNKVLTKELAEFRSQHDDLISKINTLELLLSTATADLQKFQQLNQKLEIDMADLQDASSNKFNDNASLISGISRMNRGSIKNGSLVSLNSTGEDNSSILPIITKQRDRFREKNNELEEELRKQYNIVNDLKRQTNALKTDNEELYERTRYLASFKHGNDPSLFQPVETQSFSARTSNRKLLQPKPNMKHDTVDLENDPYQRTYESKLHPIEQFRIREQERISSRLSPVERLFIFVTRAILATRTTRTIFMVYCVALHCIVMFITVYSMNLQAHMLPEVGVNTSTGGLATGLSGSPDKVEKIVEAIHR